ncbi:lipopolysaccharide biosynthesis protein, partial [Candidatus Bathyarchaeota archaeon]
EFIYQFAGTLADFIVAVSAVLILRNVWALVFGLLAGNFARFVVSYFIHPYRPHLSSDLGKAKELFGFGKWILGSSILIFLLTQGDDIFVGKLLGATALGFYQMAYRISNIPATEITHVISQVTFPAYSKLQDNIPKLREAYLKVLQVTAFLSFPIAGLIFVLAPDFTKIFLGEKWMPMVPAMQVLAIFGVTRALNATNGPIFYALGNPRIGTKISFVQLIFLAIIIYPFTNVGKLIGISWAVTLANLLCFSMSFYSVLKYIPVKKLDMIYIFSFHTLSTLCSVLSVYFFKHLISTKLPSFSIFIISILIALATYLGCSNILNLFFKQPVLGTYSLFKELFSGRKL